VVDKSDIKFPTENIRSLLNQLTVGIDSRLQKLREGSRYANVRNSDVKVFVRAFRSPATVSDIARSLDVTRQAVHASVQRLVDMKIVELQPLPHNSRDKLVVVTERGRHAQETAVNQIDTIEAEMASLIGVDELRAMRRSLAILAQSFKPPV
jgi:DNA-binding MarR family transcriptional regulator